MAVGWDAYWLAQQADIAHRQAQWLEREAQMKWKLVYTVQGRSGMRSMYERFATRREAEQAAQLMRLRRYEIWGRCDEEAGP